MIKIIYERDEYIMTMIGHAGFADPGTDIVCAGVSALTQAMLRRVKGRLNWQPAYGVNREKSVIRVHLTPKTKYARWTAREMLDTIWDGYLAIAKDYPDYVKLEER